MMKNRKQINLGAIQKKKKMKLQKMKSVTLRVRTSKYVSWLVVNVSYIHTNDNDTAFVKLRIWMNVCILFFSHVVFSADLNA